MKISEEQPYRSERLVNKSCDRVRVTLLLTTWEWRKIRKFLKDNAWEKDNG